MPTVGEQASRDSSRVTSSRRGQPRHQNERDNESPVEQLLAPDPTGYTKASGHPGAVQSGCAGPVRLPPLAALKAAGDKMIHGVPSLAIRDLPASAALGHAGARLLCVGVHGPVPRLQRDGHAL